MLAVGLMSGTSLDGIDAALVDVSPSGRTYRVTIRRFRTFAFEPGLRAALLEALPPKAGSVSATARLHHQLGRALAQAGSQIAAGDAVDYVASHGQTVYHDGGAGVTLQIGDPFIIREALRATVCFDFRSADCAAGGHGAPLVARVDALLLSSPHEERVALNLGGIANITLLPKDATPEEAVAFDTGPANMLIDAFVRQRSNGSMTFDRDGEAGSAGQVDGELLDEMLGDEYFAMLPPKTTGRERFGAQFLARFQSRLSSLSIKDGAATLGELTAASVSEAIARAGFSGARIVVSGGGAHNKRVLARLAARLPNARVETSDSMGIPVDAKEAIAFAVLGYETLRERGGNVPAATGATHSTVLGAIAPHNLHELLARMEAECRATQ